MTVSAAQAEAFYAEILADGIVWAVRDEGGFPAPMGADGRRAMPFWSKRSRVEKVIAQVAAYTGFEPEGIPLDTWAGTWLLGLRRDGLLVGLNWSGSTAVGYDIEPDAVRENLLARGFSTGEGPPSGIVGGG